MLNTAKLTNWPELHLILSTVALLLVGTLTLIYKICFQKGYDMETLVNSNQKGIIFYVKLLFYFTKENFDVIKIFSLLSKEKGYFHINLIFRKFVLVTNPDYVQMLLSIPENVDRPLVSIGLKHMADDSLLVRNGEKWRIRREMLNPVFYSKFTKETITKIEKYSRKLLESLNKNKINNIIDVEKPIKLYIGEFTLENILGLSNTTRFLENFLLCEDAVNKNLSSFSERIFNVFKLNFLYIFTSKKRAAKRALDFGKKLFRESLFEEMELRKNDSNSNSSKKSQHPTVLDILIPALKTNPDVTVHSILDELPTIIIPGYHTTSLSICWCLYELGYRPDLQKKIQEELDSIFNDDFTRYITIEDLKKMNYLKCVIKEGLRMYPTVPFTTRTATTEMKFGSETFPKNCEYIISLFHVQRYPSVYSNPNKFDPDRILPENMMNRNPYSLIPFSVGPRKCIGYRYAMVQMKIYLANIFRRFNVETLTKVTPIMGPIILDREGSFSLKFTERSWTT